MKSSSQNVDNVLADIVAATRNQPYPATHKEAKRVLYLLTKAGYRPQKIDGEGF